MSSGDDAHLLGELQGLLEKQLTSARRGSFSELEELAGRCESLVKKISADGTFGMQEFKERRTRIVRQGHAGRAAPALRPGPPRHLCPGTGQGHRPPQSLRHASMTGGSVSVAVFTGENNWLLNSLAKLWLRIGTIVDFVY